MMDPIPGHNIRFSEDNTATPRISEENPRKRGRTACTRCKNRKQKCDSLWPVCSNCRKADVECDLNEIRADEGPPARYTRALEERVAFLEIQLSRLRTQGQSSDDPTTSTTTSPSGPQNALGEVVDLLSLGRFEAPAYVGSSSGFSLAVNLGEMVQATVWNKALTGQADAGRGEHDGGHGTNHDDGYRSSGGGAITMEDLRTKSAGPPSEDEGNRLVNAYFTRLHVRYPFLDRAEIWKLHADRLRLANTRLGEMSKAERFGIFKLYMVYAIGAMTLQLTEKHTSPAPESYYMAALQHVSAARESRTVQNIQAMTLLVIYHLRCASSHGLWYMIGLAMRTCIDLGLHRKMSEDNLSPYNVQLRRRIFWTVYSLERVICISLGRPSSIADRHIDIELPHEVDEQQFADPRSPMEQPSPRTIVSSKSGTPSSAQRTSLTQAICIFQLRRLESRIHHSIYRADRHLSTLLPKMSRFYSELESWKDGVTSRFATSSEMDYLMLQYNRAVRLLIQPFLSLLPLSDPYYHICLRAAGEICQVHKRLHQSLDYGHSFIAVQTVFVAGITMLYCLWTRAEEVWSVALSNNIRACSSVLFVMGERAVWVKKYRDAFELLVNATMEKLQGNSSASGGIVETAVAAAAIGNTVVHDAHSNVRQPCYDGVSEEEKSIPADFGRSNAGGPRHDDAMRVINELANWIDQDEGTPIWMPDFEFSDPFPTTLE